MEPAILGDIGSAPSELMLTLLVLAPHRELGEVKGMAVDAAPFALGGGGGGGGGGAQGMAVDAAPFTVGGRGGGGGVIGGGGSSSSSSSLLSAAEAASGHGRGGGDDDDDEPTSGPETEGEWEELEEDELRPEDVGHLRALSAAVASPTAGGLDAP